MTATERTIELTESERTIELTATGSDERAAVAAGLAAILAAARGGNAAPLGGPSDSAVPIRGQGRDLPTVFFELGNDLLAQLDTHGAGLSTVRLDGLLRTGDGYTAWGYVLGDARVAAPPTALALVASPALDQSGDAITFRIRLIRE